MPARKSPPWTPQETAILADIYPREGLTGAADALSDRTWHAIEQRAHKLGLKSPVVGDAPQPVLTGDRLERAILLREDEGWSFGRIAAEFGVSEAGACNAVLIALCPRKGFTPAPRDGTNRLLPEGLERLRYMLRKGLKGVDIQLRLGVSAGRVALERRRYVAELKAGSKVPLPPPGGGHAYSGVKLSRASKQEVERLLLDGLGAKKVTERTGVSNTSVGRIRNRLIKRLARKGEVLLGCDRQGRRRSAAAESNGYIHPEQRAAFRALLLDGVPVSSAAAETGIGGSSAHRIRHAFAAELAAEGQALPPPEWRSPEGKARARAARWLPKGQIHRFRALVVAHGLLEAKRLVLTEIAVEREAVEAARRIERARPKSFEEQLARVARGEVGLVAKIPLRRPDYAGTLGGVATGAL